MATSNEERKRRKNVARKFKYATDLEYAKREAEKSARYRLEHPDKARACKANHYRKNKATVNAKRNARYASNPEPYKAYSAAYSREHKDEVCAYNKEYRATMAAKIKSQKSDAYQSNREEIRVKHAAYYAKNAGKVKERSSAWLKANRKRANASSSAWRAANPDKAKAIRQRWDAKHPGVGRLGKQNRRGREKAGGGKLSRDIAAKLMILQRGKCAVCRCELSAYHLDHIEPLALCGAHDDKNMQLLCKPCNLSKHAKPPIEFMQSRGFLL